MGRASLRGFSMVEVVISATMLIVGISGLVVGAHLAIRQHEHNRKVAVGLVLLEKKLEALLMLFPTSEELEEGRHPAADFERFTAEGGPVAGGADEGLYRFFYVVSLAAPIDGNDGDILPGVIIEATVAWDESLGERDITIRTVR